MVACIKFMKCIIKIGLDTNKDVILSLLQILSTPLGAGLLNPATLLLDRLIGGLLSHINRDPININNDNAQYDALKVHQDEHFLFIRHSEETSGRHVACDDQPDCITTHIIPNITTNSIPNFLRCEIKT